jgi:hypothetical protein
MEVIRIFKQPLVLAETKRMRKIYKLQFTIYKKNNGQVMLFTVLTISALFLGVTAIAGVLMNYQLRQVTNIADAAKAIFAADAATERALFVVFRCNNDTPVVPVGYDPDPLVNSGFCDLLAKEVPDEQPAPYLPEFLNNATYRLFIESTVSGTGNHDPKATSDNAVFIKAAGQAGKSTRAFGIFF